MRRSKAVRAWKKWSFPRRSRKSAKALSESCTALASIAIPANTDSIHSDAFGMCTGLASISCDAVEPPVLGDDVFYEVSRDIKLRVPAEAIEAYRNAAVWNEFNIDMSVSINQPTVERRDYSRERRAP